MRVGDRTVKIMDFGLAKGPATSMTHDGALFGTPNYMSPEQVRGDPLDGRTDLFSLGVVCYEMLTGVKPFGGDTISSVLYRVVHESPSDAPLRLEHVPPALATFLERALAKNAEARFRDGAEFAGALRKAGAAARAAPAPVSDQAERSPAPLPPEPLNESTQRSLVPWIVAIALVFAGIGAAFMLRVGPVAPPKIAMLTARVLTEPAGLPVQVNGASLEGDIIEFPAAGPFAVLTATYGCREAKHRVEAADAGLEIVLVLDPVRAAVVIDPGVLGASVTLNGQEAGAVPTTIDLDLCRDNTLDVVAEGYRTASATIPAKATPLAARTAFGALKLEAIPTGRILLPSTRVPVRFLVDGAPVERTGDGFEISAGPHEVRAVNDERFVDVAVTVDVPMGETATPALVIPPLARLAVQTFPPNCRVALKRTGSAWRHIGETPLRHELAAGRYVLRVVAPDSGETREQDINLAPGANAPIRVSFGRSGR